MVDSEGVSALLCCPLLHFWKHVLDKDTQEAKIPARSNDIGNTSMAVF
jgi:hypothetical protein